MYSDKIWKQLNHSDDNIDNLAFLLEEYHKSLHGKINYPKGSLFGKNIRGGMNANTN